MRFLYAIVRNVEKQETIINVNKCVNLNHLWVRQKWRYRYKCKTKKY